jgi:hypothetical protein
MAVLQCLPGRRPNRFGFCRFRDPRRSFLFGDLHIRLTLGKLLDKLHFCQRWQLPPFRYALRNYSRDIRHHQCFHYGRFG